VAEIGPADQGAGADLRAALEGTTPPDEAFARNISAALAMVTSKVPDEWAKARFGDLPGVTAIDA
jgi:hypothetical protein